MGLFYTNGMSKFTNDMELEYSQQLICCLGAHQLWELLDVSRGEQLEKQMKDTG